jgi:hypothetical protein
MMTLWTFLVAPLLVLPIVLLFRFVGCALIYDFDDFDTSRDRVPDYRDYILGRRTEGSVRHPEVAPNGNDAIGYWRLIDASDSQKAADEKGSYEGIYRTSSDSDVAPGNLDTGQPSLLDSAPQLRARFFNGGLVAIPDAGGLYTDKFTIEAWIDPEFVKGEEHTLFHAGGQYIRPGDLDTGKHGFRVYATKAREWQVDLEFHGSVFPKPPLIPVGSARTHLAVIVQGGSTPGTTTVTIVMDGRNPLERTVNGSYSKPDSAPLVIGVKNEEIDPRNLLTSPAPNLSSPIQSTLQEVVLHSKALSLNEIDNHISINRAPRTA